MNSKSILQCEKIRPHGVRFINCTIIIPRASYDKDFLALFFPLPFSFFGRRMVFAESLSHGIVNKVVVDFKSVQAKLNIKGTFSISPSLRRRCTCTHWQPEDRRKMKIKGVFEYAMPLHQIPFSHVNIAFNFFAPSCVWHSLYRDQT